MISSRILATLLALLAWSSVALAQSETNTPEPVSTGWAKVIEFKGDVAVQLPAQTLVAASREMILPAGTSVQTRKGSALLQLEDGSEVLVKSNSSVLLKSPAESDHHYFELLLGQIRAAVKKRIHGVPSFRLGTPTAVITVRGTQFEVTVKKNRATSVVVYEGTVEVSGMGYVGPSVLLGPGYMIDVPPTGIPSRPQRTLEMDDQYQRGTGRLDDSLRSRSRNEQGEDDRQRTSQPSVETSSGEHESPDD
jgi:ferric-dicitrate binding protein FerR (iron transport regulator)